MRETDRVHLATVAKALVMFLATNVDDLVVLMVFFGRARGDRVAVTRVVVGQYLGFAAIVVVSVFAALGTRLLPDEVIGYFGLVPVALGVRAAWAAWRQGDDDDDWQLGDRPGVGIPTVAAVTIANGGDNIGVYVPVFAVAGPSDLLVYLVVFGIGVGLWCLLSQRIAAHPPVAAVLERWEHLLLPVVLIGIGVAVMVEGGVFGR